MTETRLSLGSDNSRRGRTESVRWFSIWTHVVVAIGFAWLCSQDLMAQPRILHSLRSGDSLYQPIRTSELLQWIKWDSLQARCLVRQTIQEYCDTSVSQDKRVVEYEYSGQTNQQRFYVMSFDGVVVEYRGSTTSDVSEIMDEYFDKISWLSYAHSRLPHLQDTFKLTSAESKKTLQAYYRLLGVETEAVYDWICEYSTVGIAPGRRQAVIALLGERDLLLRLLSYPNVYVQLYAADALIYNDRKIRSIVAKYRPDVDSVEYQSSLLTPAEWAVIHAIRDSDQKIVVCSDAGSYKHETSTTKDALSDEALSHLEENYGILKDLGYFRP